MIKDSISSEDLQKILAAFLSEPTRSFTYYSLNKNPLLKEVSNSSIHRGVRRLTALNILKVIQSKGKPKGGERIKNFSLIERRIVFETIFKTLSNEDFQELLLSSEYTDHIIKKYRFIRVFNIIKERLSDPAFKRRASKALLNQPAAVEEYRNSAKFMSKLLLKYYEYALFDYRRFGIDLKEEIRPSPKHYAEIYGLLVDRTEATSPLDLRDRSEASSFLSDDKIQQIKSKIGYLLRPVSSKHIEMLTEFDRLQAICLYRNVILKEIAESFEKLSEIPAFSSEGMRQFMEFDNYLSPFTSYPVQSPEIPLFSRPFQRIYDDVYLLGPDDLKVLAYRAFVIYNNFASVLSEFFKYSAPRDKKALRRELMEFIYLWNISSTNFDLVWLYLKDTYKEQIGSGNYHIQSDGIRFCLNDLETNKPLPDEERYIKIFSPKPILFEKRYEARRSMDRPFTRLRPCLCFQDLFGWSGMISINQILSELKPSYEKYDVDKIEDPYYLLSGS